jgi:hypothetical protein
MSKFSEIREFIQPTPEEEISLNLPRGGIPR